jgi:hypothetical protein
MSFESVMLSFGCAGKWYQSVFECGLKWSVMRANIATSPIALLHLLAVAFLLL